jgi:hypothetical protein
VVNKVVVIQWVWFLFWRLTNWLLARTESTRRFGWVPGFTNISIFTWHAHKHTRIQLFSNDYCEYEFVMWVVISTCVHLEQEWSTWTFVAYTENKQDEQPSSHKPRTHIWMKSSKRCLPPASTLVSCSVIFRPWRCRRYVPPKSPLTSRRHCYFLLLFLVGWDSVHLVLRPQFGLLYQPRMIDDGDCGAIGGMIGRRNRNIRRKLAPVNHFAHHKSHMTWPGFKPGPPKWETSV